MKKFCYLIFGFFLSIFIVPSIYALDTSIKVYDYADILTSSEEELLQEEIEDFIDKYNMDMVIVSVDSHNKSSTQAYADDFYDYNGFGLGSTNDGLILVIDFNFGNTNMYISTTGEAIRMYDDNRIDNILDVIYYDYDYYELYHDFIDESSYYASLGIPASNKNTYINSNGDLVKKKSFPIVALIFFPTVGATIILLILIYKNKMVKKASKANVYLNKSSITISERSDKFIMTHTTSHIISSDSGGGSSTHHGSSGISHGGGGRSR